MDKLFIDLFRTATYYTFYVEELYDIFPIHEFEKEYYKYKSEEVKKNMVEIVKSIIGMYFIIYSKKCTMCKNHANYSYLDNENNWRCYKHKTRRMIRRSLSDDLPFYIDGKLIQDYNSCMDASVKYSTLARNIDILPDEKVNYRILATMYFCLSSYMSDAPHGVYPKSYKQIISVVQKPEIIFNPLYKSLDITVGSIKKRENWITDYKEGKLFN